VREVHVRLRCVRACRSVAARVHSIEHPGVVGNQHNKILARIDGLCFDSRLELLLDVRIEAQPRARLTHGRSLEVGRGKRRVREMTLAVRIERPELLLESAPLQEREVRTTAVTVESIRCSPRLEQPFEVPNAEPRFESCSRNA
jgi:hypothetical protein